MYLLVRKDVKMSSGKAIAQCGHAALELAQKAPRSLVQQYTREGGTKIALKLTSLEQLEQIRDASAAVGVNYYVVVDQGRTQIAPNTTTVLGIGPIRRKVARPLVADVPLY